jgi:hypothetical protein
MKTPSLQASLAVVGGGASFAFHCDATFCHGVTEEQIRTFLLFVSEVSFSKGWQAFEAFSQQVVSAKH